MRARGRSLRSRGCEQIHDHALLWRCARAFGREEGASSYFLPTLPGSLTLAFRVGSIISRPSALDSKSSRGFVGEPSTQGEPPTSTPGGFCRVSFFFLAQGDARRKPARAFARWACTTESWKKSFGGNCAAHSGARLFHSAYPPLPARFRPNTRKPCVLEHQ